jgi:hypothetical protein
MKAIALFTILIFCFLSILHVYWAFGGKLIKGKVIPQIEGKEAFNPGFFVTMMVAVFLMLCAIVAIFLGFKEQLHSPYETYFTYAGWILAGIFILRAIGDFKLVGFFKKVKNTEFANYDYWLFSPLCMTIGIALLALT